MLINVNVYQCISWGKIISFSVCTHEEETCSCRFLASLVGFDSIYPSDCPYVKPSVGKGCAWEYSWSISLLFKYRSFAGYRIDVVYSLNLRWTVWRRCLCCPGPLSRNIQGVGKWFSDICGNYFGNSSLLWWLITSVWLQYL